MKYDKPPLTFREQADLLLSRGMRGDRATMMDRLAVVNYYRLSGYWHPFMPIWMAAEIMTFGCILTLFRGVHPKIPNKIEAWNKPVRVAGRRMFTILTICKHCLDCIAPQSHWPTRWRELLAAYPYIPRGSMGVPANWQECPIWTKAQEPEND